MHTILVNTLFTVAWLFVLGYLSTLNTFLNDILKWVLREKPIHYFTERELTIAKILEGSKIFLIGIPIVILTLMLAIIPVLLIWGF